MCVRALSLMQNKLVLTSTRQMKWLLRQMCSNGHINSIEVAVLCLMQKIMDDYAWSSKMTIEVHAGANIFKSCPKLVLSYTILRITSSSRPAFVSPQPLPKTTKY